MKTTRMKTTRDWTDPRCIDCGEPVEIRYDEYSGLRLHVPRCEPCESHHYHTLLMRSA